MSAAKAPRQTVHRLESPFTAVRWPEISQDDQNTILELLCSLLSPLGQHRRDHVPPSKGRRSKAAAKKTPGPEAPPAPPAPELASFVDVGLAAISRALQDVASRSGPHSTERYSAVFVARGDHNAAFDSHFPQMVAVASRRHPDQQPVRLVGFSRACGDRLSSCLGIPRVSAVGLRAGAPQAKALEDFIHAHVPAVEMAWLSEALAGQYRDTKIKSTETTAGDKRRRKAERAKKRAKIKSSRHAQLGEQLAGHGILHSGVIPAASAG